MSEPWDTDRQAMRQRQGGRQPSAQEEPWDRDRRRGSYYEEGRRRARGAGTVGAFVGTVNEAIPGADEVGAALGTVVGVADNVVHGRPADVGGQWRGMRDFQRGQLDEFRENHPNAANLATGIGYAIPAALTMGASAGPTTVTTAVSAPAASTTAVARPVSRPIARAVARRVGRAAAGATRNAVTGAAISSGYAASGRGSAAERAQAARDAALPGAVVGVGAPAAAKAARVITERVVAPAARVAGRTAVRVANRVADEPFLDPNAEAQNRLVEAMRRDRLTPEQITAALTEWQRTRSPTPAFMDLVNAGGRGQNTMALVRSAAEVGPARSVAATYANRVTADMQDNAIERTRQLTPREQRPAPVLRQGYQDRIDAASQPPQTVQPGSGGARLSQGLNARRDEAWGQVNAAYDAARASDAQQALVPRAEMPRIVDALHTSVETFDPVRVPAVQRELNRLNGLTDLTAEDLFLSRSVLTNLAASNDPVEAAAARAARSAIDSETARVEPLLTGDPTAVGLWRNANSQRAAFGRQFEGDDLTQTITERGRHGSGNTNLLSPEDVSNAVLGRNGVAPRRDMARDLARIRDQLGADSAEWRAFQDEATDRILGQGGADRAGALERFRTNNSELANLLVPADRAASAAANQRTIAQNTGYQRALDIGATGVRAAPDEYALNFERLGDDQDLAGIGMRQGLTDAIGAPAENATGTLNRISSGTNVGRNLDTTYGPEVAAPYRTAIGNTLEQVRNARFIDPTSGSQTFGRAEGAAIPEIPHGWLGLARVGIRKLTAGVALTDAESEAIVHLATSMKIGAAQQGVLDALPAPTSAFTPRVNYGQPITNVFSAQQGQQRSDR